MGDASDAAAFGLDILGSADAYQDQILSIEGAISRSESQQRIIGIKSAAAAGQYSLDRKLQAVTETGFGVQHRAVDIERDRTGLKKAGLGLEGQRLDLKSQGINLAAQGIDLDRVGLLNQERRLDIQSGLLESKGGSARRGADIQRGLLSSEVRVAEVQRRGQLAQQAFASKDLKLGLAAETQKARVESARAKMLHAKGGASAFTKAYSAMSTNALSSFEQKQTALKLEGIISESIFSERMTQSGLRGEEVDRQLLAAMDEINAQQGMLGIARDDLALDSQRLNIKDSELDLQRAGIDIDRNALALQEDELNLNLDALDLQDEQIRLDARTSALEFDKTEINYYAGQQIYKEQYEEEGRQQEFLDEQLDGGLYGDIMNTVDEVGDFISDAAGVFY